MGIASKILYEETGPGLGPLGPKNVIIFANGPLNGTRAPCNGRVEMTTKSPLTGLIGSANTGGMWGARLKHTGYDTLIIRSAAEKPTYLWINDDEVELRDASHLWGKDTWQTTDRLMSELGCALPPEFAVLAIGPAGEICLRHQRVLSRCSQDWCGGR